ncbi:RsmB/NOP family class I SAM-dependent RNA methyltransferase [Rhodobium gokarnense]|uniref:16S rRNA (Cytosine967-C5)-methyltransferase n=1 Tax=Rhodobium gokarnense TaxID=364296 RepID=A0ABT3HE27_9HYPH|nr:transcription antitermination factor NusB [Rhodobium gokarnense]MCW2308647.1 16S rRNA (cytosine967-C5)-methyltransferase [Rhodobium gokarnense]
MSSKRSQSADLAQAGLAARRVAVDILESVTDRGRRLEDVLESALNAGAASALIAKDRALVRAIVGTALRRKGQITDALGRLMKSRPPAKAHRLDHILAVGAAQILFMDVPDHAAVSLAVTQAVAEPRLRPFKNLVNGVLRNLGRQRDAILSGQDAERLNTPDWLWQRWEKAYGPENARRFAAMHALEPSLDITVRSDPGGWAERLGAAVLPTGSLRLIPSGPIDRLDGFAEGAWWVQDAAAALPARLLGDIAGKRVADLCAAPGGKTAQLAAAGANVTAVDISAARLKRVEENLARLGLGAEIVAADLTDWTPEAPFDAILLDAPCSATGTVRRHPDLPWRRSGTEIESLAALQAEMLRQALSWLKPGGEIVYCTCSLEPEEGEAQVARALQEMPGLERRPIEAGEIGGLADLVTADGDLRTLPCHLSSAEARLSGLDGFFAARLRRP